jgi:hypothetical protein
VAASSVALSERFALPSIITHTPAAIPEASSSSLRFQSTAAAAATTAAEPAKTTTTTTTTTDTMPFTPTPERKYQYFQNVEITPEGVAVIRFDSPKTVNTISFAVKDEAEKLWKTEIDDQKDKIKAVVFSSGKPGMFIAGADIFDIKGIEDKRELVPLIEDGLRFFQHMKNSGIPLVCAIDGPALGGGLEWVLWCGTCT